MIEPRFLTLEDVLSLHEDQLERYGGMAGMRDAGGLESAVETARATFDGQYLHDGLFAMAAAYAFHIAESQAFVDGNKRTGLNAALVFLLLNGWLVRDPAWLSRRGLSMRQTHRAGDKVFIDYLSRIGL